MIMLEKINIYMAEVTKQQLMGDARLFEVFKGDGRSVNLNKFLNKLILGYSRAYAEEFNATRLKIVDELEGAGIQGNESLMVATRIMNSSFFPAIVERPGKKTCRVPLKATVATEGLLLDIIEGLTSSDSLSGYLCRMLRAYCIKPSAERERIIHSEVWEVLETALERHQAVAFTTTRRTGFRHKVIPYKVVVGQGEQFNYLLCAENNADGVQLASTYRLCRIDRPHLVGDPLALNENVRTHLQMMEKHGPQFAINENIESCVRLTEEGVESLMRISHGRPQEERVEQAGDDHLYYYRCSQNQLFLYFRRFGNKEAEVVKPESLRNKIIEFHKGALAVYNSQNCSTS